MNCPVCKYPNAAGATHCNLCQEVLGRSAAKSYLHAVRKERHMREMQESSSSPSLDLQPAIDRMSGFFQRVDWSALVQTVTRQWRLYRQGILLALGVAAAAGMVMLFHSPLMTFQLFGGRLPYKFQIKKPATYLIGLHTEEKSWSERQGRLDTPLTNFQWDDIGTVKLERKKTPKDRQVIAVKPHEWIQIEKTQKGSHSRAIPLSHSSLAPGAIVLDSAGTVLQRAYQPSPRLAKAMDFIMPSFPPGRIRAGQHWTEPVQWIEMFGDWKIYWVGELQWTLEGQTDCGVDPCEHLIYRANIQPQLWAGPSWSAGVVRRVGFNGTARGDAFFDGRRGVLLSNTFSYAGLFRIPITDLRRIPWEIRVGRPVTHVPGEILIDFKNKIDIRKN